MAIKRYTTWTLKQELEWLRTHKCTQKTVVMAEEIPAEEKEEQSGRLLILNNTPEVEPKSVAMNQDEIKNYQSIEQTDKAVNGYLIHSKYNQGVLEVTIQKCTIV